MGMKYYNLHDKVTDSYVLHNATAREVSEYVSNAIGEKFLVQNVNGSCRTGHRIRKRFKVLAGTKPPEKSAFVITEQEVDLMQKYYMAGKSLTEISKIMNRARHTVSARLRARGVRIRDTYETSYTRQQKPVPVMEYIPSGHVNDEGKLLALWNAGWCVGNIASEFDCKPEEVVECLKMLRKKSTSCCSTLTD